jgi:hypothetical protein
MAKLTDATQWLARNPLGIVALFVVLIEAIAGLTLGFTRSALPADQLSRLIWFLVGFPFVVLGVFAWLVAKHPGKLYAPGDFASDEGFFKSLGVGDAPINVPTPMAASELVEGQSLGEEEIVVDGKRYVNCTFHGTTLIFRGERAVMFESSTFGDVRWRLEGPAALTLNFLRALATSGEVGKTLVLNTLSQVVGGPIGAA